MCVLLGDEYIPNFHNFTGSLRSYVSKAIRELEKKDNEKKYWFYIKHSHDNALRDIRHGMRVLIK